MKLNGKAIGSNVVKLTLAGLVGGFAAASVMSAPVMPGFGTADGNHDGHVSLVEFAALGGHPQAFKEGDTNDDSRLSQDEYTKAVANHDRIKAAKFTEDAWITAKVKAKLLSDDGVSSLAVSVETYKGTVQLSGWVEDPMQIVRAEKIALSVEGVKSVRNDLMVKG